MRAFLAFLFALLTFAAHAEQITIVVPTPPGSAPDISARKISAEMANFGVQSIVSNHPGGDGAVGVRAFFERQNAKLLIGGPAVGYIAESQTVQGFSMDQLVPIALLMSDQKMVIYTSENSPLKTFDDLLKAPSISAGSSAFPTSAIRFMLKERGVYTIDANYSSNASLMADLISGRIDIAISGTQNDVWNEQRKAGRIRAIAIASGSDPEFIGVTNAKLSAFPLYSWVGVFAKADLPAAELESLRSNVLKSIERTGEHALPGSLAARRIAEELIVNRRYIASQKGAR